MITDLNIHMRGFKTFIVIMSSIITSSFFAKAENESYKFQATLFGGMYVTSEPAWQLEPSITWRFSRLFGVSLGLEMTSQMNQPSRFTTINGIKAELADNEREPGWFIINPSVAFRTPAIWKNKDGDNRLWFQIEPGISFACPFKNSLTFKCINSAEYEKFNNKGLRWFYWNARISLNLEIDRFVFGAGYGISDLDYYSSRRNVVLQDGSKFHVPKKELSQNIFLLVGFQFDGGNKRNIRKPGKRMIYSSDKDINFDVIN